MTFQTFLLHPLRVKATSALLIGERACTGDLSDAVLCKRGASLSHKSNIFNDQRDRPFLHNINPFLQRLKVVTVNRKPAQSAFETDGCKYF